MFVRVRNRRTIEVARDIEDILSLVGSSSRALDINISCNINYIPIETVSEVNSTQDDHGQLSKNIGPKEEKSHHLRGTPTTTLSG